MRPSGRDFNEIREVSIEVNVLDNALGSCMIKLGGTHVICSVSVDNYLPQFLKGSNSGWLTAEYGMLPNCSDQRIRREAMSGKQTGRTVEIQRLISRSLRASVDLKLLGPRQVIVDCDVINADGGTRTAAITGGYVALSIAMEKLVQRKILKKNPIKSQIAAISCGIYGGKVVADLDYKEDSNAIVDANFVLDSNNNIIEVQGTGEGGVFTRDQLVDMTDAAIDATKKLFLVQNEAILKTYNLSI